MVCLVKIDHLALGGKLYINTLYRFDPERHLIVCAHFQNISAATALPQKLRYDDSK
jgi:hypothetical protein